ncbi:permease [candidate division FCPU426 bacterium]|nr:permease [candidate division FCPU426 bacterium]
MGARTRNNTTGKPAGNAGFWVSFRAKGHGRWPDILTVVFILAVLLPAFFWRQTEQMQTLALTFSSILLEAFPFIALGAVISGCLEVYLPRERMIAWLPRGWSAVFIGSGLGLVFPVCECAVVPVVRRLLHKGMPLGAGIAFLLGGPIVNPLVAASTAVAYQFDWKVVILRLAAGYTIACLAGWLADYLLRGQEAVIPCAGMKKLQEKCCAAGKAKTNGGFWRVLAHAQEDFFAVGRYFLIGAFIAAVIQTFLSRQAFFSAVAGSPVLIILVMMILAVLLNLCSEADAFVAASFQSTLVSLTGQMAFMVLGPMLDLKLLVMYFSVFTKRATATVAGLVFLLVFGCMLLLEFLP